MTFQKKYFSILNTVQFEIQEVLEQMTEGIDLQEPLKSKLFTLLNAPSKHIRPLVSFLYLKATNENIDENQILYQSAIELVHNASLIHDDVIDESQTRRNIKTLNNEFGNKLAIISGDYLLAAALDKVIKIGSVELIQMFSDTLAVMSEGEINQYFNRFKIPTIDEYIKKSEQKTAKLFETSLCGGLLIADGSFPLPLREREEFLSKRSELRNSGEGLNEQGLKFARNFGIAFQIRDDLINCKTTKSDIKDGIYTAPVIFSGGEEITPAAIEKTKDLLNNYIDNALNRLSGIPDNKYKLGLTELLELMRDE